MLKYLISVLEGLTSVKRYTHYIHPMTVGYFFINKIVNSFISYCHCLNIILMSSAGYNLHFC